MSHSACGNAAPTCRAAAVPMLNSARGVAKPDFETQRLAQNATLDRSGEASILGRFDDDAVGSSFAPGFDNVLGAGGPFILAQRRGAGGGNCRGFPQSSRRKRLLEIEQRYVLGLLQIRYRLRRGPRTVCVSTQLDPSSVGPPQALREFDISIERIRPDLQHEQKCSFAHAAFSFAKGFIHVRSSDEPFLRQRSAAPAAVKFGHAQADRASHSVGQRNLQRGDRARRILPAFLQARMICARRSTGCR